MKKEIDFSKIPDKEKAKELELSYIARKNNILKENALQKQLELTYRYFRFWKKDIAVSVSFGYRKIGDVVKYTVALQSKKDYFSRKEARKHINRRWKNGNVVKFTIPFNTRDIDILIAIHWNSRQISLMDYQIIYIPKYLSRIPILFN